MEDVRGAQRTVGARPLNDMYMKITGTREPSSYWERAAGIAPRTVESTLGRWDHTSTAGAKREIVSGHACRVETILALRKAQPLTHVGGS